jgi:hypothetical protein
MEFLVLVVGNREQNKSVAGTGLTLDYDITICIKGICCDGTDCIHLLQGNVQRWAFVNTTVIYEFYGEQK